MLFVDWLRTKWNWASAWSILSPSSRQKQALPNKWFCFTEKHHIFTLQKSIHSHQYRLSISCSHKEFYYLIIHDDLVCHRIEQSGLRNELFLGIFVFLFTCLLDIVSCQCVQTSHLVLLVISVVKVSINTSCLQKLDEILCFALFVVLQLEKTRVQLLRLRYWANMTLLWMNQISYQANI